MLVSCEIIVKKLFCIQNFQSIFLCYLCSTLIRMDDVEIVLEVEKYLRSSEKNQELIQKYLESHFARTHGYPEPLLDSDVECAQFMLDKWEESKETRGLLKRFLQLACVNSPYFMQGLQPPGSPKHTSVVEGDLIEVDSSEEESPKPDGQQSVGTSGEYDSDILHITWQHPKRKPTSPKQNYSNNLPFRRSEFDSIFDSLHENSEPEYTEKSQRSDLFSPKLSSTLHGDPNTEQENKSTSMHQNVPSDIPFQKYWIEKES